MVITSQKQTGDWGERWAEDYLKGQGMKLLERNWRAGKGEIDLIMSQGRILVFVEVRVRRRGSLVPPYASIRRRKWQVLRRVCLAYVGELKWHPEALRMDVVGVEHGGNEKPTLAHYANVGLFGKWRV